MDNIDAVEETSFSIEEIIETINLQTRCFSRFIEVCTREGLECFPKVLSFHSQKKIGNTFYGVLVEEFVNGITLDKMFDQLIDKDIKVVTNFLKQMRQVILKMSNNGIVHRDIFPDNIMFSEN